MATAIRSWQIVDGKLAPIETDLAREGRTEHLDLEAWIASDPSILAPGLAIIGRQVPTPSGPLDLLGIDRAGNAVVVELKRDRLPREVLAQAVDYASAVAEWTADKLSEICATYTGRDLETVLSDTFPDTDLESISINESQRILLVGFSVETALERMISWMSSTYGVGVNAVVLNYVRTSGGDEVLTKTVVVPEDVEEQRARRRKFEIPMSDVPGQHQPEQVRAMLREYLAKDEYAAIRNIRDVLAPALLQQKTVSRLDLVKSLVASGLYDTPTAAGYAAVHISKQIGAARNDFLRQVFGYDYPDYPWAKDNYVVREGMRDLLQEVLAELSEGHRGPRHLASDR